MWKKNAYWLLKLKKLFFSRWISICTLNVYNGRYLRVYENIILNIHSIISRGLNVISILGIQNFFTFHELKISPVCT